MMAGETSSWDQAQSRKWLIGINNSGSYTDGQDEHLGEKIVT
jgi:hypothetical protein